MLKRAIIIASMITASAAAAKTVAIVPLATLGTEDTSAAIKTLTTQLETATSGLAGTKLVPAATVADAIKKARKPQLRSCENEASCLAEVGRLVGAELVIAGEIGGLGDAKVIYFSLTDVKAEKNLRSTTLAAKGDKDSPQAAIVRLLDPDRYRGTLHFDIDVTGATVFVNGSKQTLSAKGEVTMLVGTQAVRVTHPEYQDFVRFIEVPYGRPVDVPVRMRPFPIIQRDVQGRPISRDKVRYIDPPVWRRWYVVAPVAVGLGVAAGIIAGIVVNRLPATDGCKIVGGGDC